jgi:hypothetical protein
MATQDNLFAKVLACAIGRLIVGFVAEKLVILVKKVLPKKQ